MDRVKLIGRRILVQRLHNPGVTKSGLWLPSPDECASIDLARITRGNHEANKLKKEVAETYNKAAIETTHDAEILLEKAAKAFPDAQAALVEDDYEARYGGTELANIGRVLQVSPAVCDPPLVGSLVVFNKWLDLRGHPALPKDYLILHEDEIYAEISE